MSFSLPRVFPTHDCFLRQNNLLTNAFLCFQQRSRKSEFKSFEMWTITFRKVFSNLFRGHSLFGGDPQWRKPMITEENRKIQKIPYRGVNWKRKYINTVITCILSPEKLLNILHMNLCNTSGTKNHVSWTSCTMKRMGWWGGLEMDCYSFCFRSTLQYRLSTGQLLVGKLQ